MIFNLFQLSLVLILRASALITAENQTKYLETIKKNVLQYLPSKYELNMK